MRPLKKPSVLNVSNGSSKPEEFSIKVTEMIVDSKEQNLFKRAHIGRYLGIARIITSTAKLSEEDIRSRAFLQAEGGIRSIGPPGEDAQDHDMFISLTGALYVAINSQKDKGKALKKHILKDIVPRGFDVKIEETQEKHQRTIDGKDATIALLNDSLENREYEDVGLQGEVRVKDQQLPALQRRYISCLLDEDKNNGITIIAKNNNEAKYPHISICGEHGYRRHKVRVLLTRNKGSTLFVDGDTPNTIVIYNIWQEHSLIVVDTDRPRHFRLDMINQEQLLALNNM